MWSLMFYTFDAPTYILKKSAPRSLYLDCSFCLCISALLKVKRKTFIFFFSITVVIPWDCHGNDSLKVHLLYFCSAQGTSWIIRFRNLLATIEAEWGVSTWDQPAPWSHRFKTYHAAFFFVTSYSSFGEIGKSLPVSATQDHFSIISFSRYSKILVLSIQFSISILSQLMASWKAWRWGCWGWRRILFSLWSFKTWMQQY